MVSETDLNDFMNEFKEKVEKYSSVDNVEFFGSIKTSDWKVGKSDIDIKVFGNNIPGKTKRKIRQLLRVLNKKYNLKLGKARCCHPTPFFLDSPQRRQGFNQMMKGHSPVVQIARQVLKENAPTYEEVWQMEENVKKSEEGYPIPKLSKLFDKFS